MYAPKTWEGASMKANECLATLKNTFDTHYSGNRVPMTLGMHPDYYMKSRDKHYKSAGNFVKRRKIIEDFILYVLQNPDVRIITGHSLIAWMRNPVALGEAPVLDERGEPTRINANRKHHRAQGESDLSAETNASPEEKTTEDSKAKK